MSGLGVVVSIVLRARTIRRLVGASAVAVAAALATAPGAPAAPVAASTVGGGALAAAAVAQVGKTTGYDPSYVVLKYPGGDVPVETGVCTDVVIRAYRALGLDLQVAVRNDRLRHGLRSDPNIDQRRVPALIAFFSHAHATQPASHNPLGYQPGDVVMWNVDGLNHTGIVAAALVPGTSRHLVVHNIGDGAQLEDVLFAWPIIAHFRYSAPATRL